MHLKKGVAVSPGISIRPAYVLDTEELSIPKRNIESSQVQAALERYRKARQAAVEELQALQHRVEIQLGKELSGIFKAHQMLIEDPTMCAQVEKRITDELHSPEYAVTRSYRNAAKRMQSIGDRIFAERVRDIWDVENRLVRHLVGERLEEFRSLSEDVILIAVDLSPSQTAGLDKEKTLGFATDQGGRTSHTAIVAKALGIPAVVGLGNITSEVNNGDLVIIDGRKGIVIVDPDEPTLADYRNKERLYRAFQSELSEIRDLPAETIDGYRIHMWANIESPEEIEHALANGAEGIGLYRTEFLYVNKPEPSEEDHFSAYKRSIELLHGRPIVIRTLDLGGDKFFVEESVTPEKNPFLGCRSIRYCFEHLNVFKTQLRAILRASAYGPVRIMIPMISSMMELMRVHMILDDVRNELDDRGVPYDRSIPLGIMVEVPSAAIVADQLSKKIDFFSVGTNDLVQYTLAVDRVNERVANLYQPIDPSVIRLVTNVIEVGRDMKIPVSMCGEMCGEVEYTLPLIGLGLFHLSLAPAMIPEVKAVIRSISMREAKDLVRTIRNSVDPRRTERYLKEKVRKIIPQLF